MAACSNDARSRANIDSSPNSPASVAPAIQRLDAADLRADIERLSDRLLIRFRPAVFTSGVTYGPTVSIELSAEHARLLGDALVSQSEILGAHSHG